MLRKDAPISAGEIAASLGSSRRTLFRELKNAAPMLAAYNVSIASVPGKGLGLRSCGTDSAGTRKKLADALREKSACRLPSSRKERRLGLIVKLLGDSNVHKLCYFANALGISEATVSNDLDELEPWLNKRFITLVRRPGLGVCVDAEEAAIRRALLRRLVLDGLMGRLPYLKTLGYPPPDITDGMDELFTNRFDRAFNWMTEDSSDMLRLFLIVGIERIAKGFLLAEEENPTESGGYLRQLSNFIADNLEARFSVSLPPPERAAIARQLKTCRAMLQNQFDPAKSRDYSYIQSLVHEMIERFDPELAPSLKMNENLLTGLSLHLWAALDRLEKQMELPDTMHNEVAEKFPELFQKKP
jgi:mannitol operon transcriptional antiterminator